MILVAGLCVAQDPASSHFYANPLYMNPAMAGVEGKAKAGLAYRNQWPAAADAYTTIQASYEQYVDALNGGIGLHLINDRQGGGIMNTTGLDLMYSYHVKLSRFTTVTGGLQASVGQRSINADGLVLPDALEGGGTQLASASKWYPDFATGMAFFHRNWFGGLAVHHLVEPYMSPSRDPNTRLSRKYTAHVGTMIPIYEKRFGKEVMQLSPNLVFQQQDIYQQLNYGLELHYRDLLGGLWFRQDLGFNYGTLIFSVGYARDKFRFRYSYDTRLSSPGIQIPVMGAHEISLSYIFENLYKSGRQGAIKSPKI